MTNDELATAFGDVADEVRAIIDGRPMTMAELFESDVRETALDIQACLGEFEWRIIHEALVRARAALRPKRRPNPWSQ